MSRTITIPKNNKPFIVNINNREYIYRGGETVEVPDEVAEAIEDALELEPKPKRYLSKLAQRAEGSLIELTASDLVDIETIAAYAFAFCKSIPTVAIPNGIKTIKDHAFYSCIGLKSVAMGNSITKIESYAFDWCTSLTSVHLPKTPPALDNINAFTNISPTCVFYCKDQASLDAYKAAPIWSTLAGTYSFVVEE